MVVVLMCGNLWCLAGPYTVLEYSRDLEFNARSVLAKEIMSRIYF